MLADSLTAPAVQIAELLTARNETVAVAEVSSGGLIAAALVGVPGASAYFRGGVVLYTVPGAVAMLADATDLDPGPRGACESFARFLAHATALKHSANWGVSETGASGPNGNPYGDPAGHTWVAACDPSGAIDAQHLLTGDTDRAANMERFAAHALNTLLMAIRAS